MNNLTNIMILVEGLLYERPQCRDNDDILYWNVIKRVNPDALKREFGEVIINLKQFGLPSRDTVTRARRKVQEENPELKAKADVRAFRADLEGVYREVFK